MEHLKQIIQLYKDGISIREITRRVGVSRNSVRRYLSRLKSVSEPSDSELAALAYDNDQLTIEAERLQACLDHIKHQCSALGRTGVTRQLLWNEYLAEHPEGYSYSRYCYHLKHYLKNQDMAMHLEYEPGDFAMIDFAGKKLDYVELETGACIECEMFVSVLPFSGLIFCDVVHTQQTEDFVHCINSMKRYYGGVTATVLCDNMRTAVKRADRYEPQFTDVCLQLSEHYGTTFSATRPYSPRDKAMVERAVRIVYDHIYGPLRHRTFTSLDALREAIGALLTQLNDKPYKRTPYSRRYYFEQQERSVLKPLPAVPFSSKKVVQLTVQRNYHVQLSEDRRYYSVPYQYVGKKVKVLYDASVVEIYLDLQRIALHDRKPHRRSSYITLAAHMPPHHQKMQAIRGWSREDLLTEAARVGPSVHKAATRILDNSFFIEQNYKSCFGMLRLQNKYGAARLELACERAILGSRVNYTLIKSILERGLDKLSTIPTAQPLPHHENIRGKDHYQ